MVEILQRSRAPDPAAPPGWSLGDNGLTDRPGCHCQLVPLFEYLPPDTTPRMIMIDFSIFCRISLFFMSFSMMQVSLQDIRMHKEMQGRIRPCIGIIRRPLVLPFS
jgi:hypothetical protein